MTATVRDAEAPVAPPAPVSVDAPHYRPAIDGLRAVAVYLVVLFHAKSDRFSGGFVGVDVFFVLSGYLVTQLLLRDLAGSGHIGFARFYSRRFRRLLPAAFFTLVVTALVWAAVATRGELYETAGGFRAAFLYYANWFFLDQANDYFAGDVQQSPVLHFWSLAIEEQFYLLWPLLLSGLFAFAARVSRHRTAAVRLFVGGIAALSLVRAIQLADVNVSRSYYGTDTRAYQLLAGALLALTPALFAVVARRTRMARHAIPVLLGLLVTCSTSLVDVEPVWRGVLATALTAGLILAVEGADGGAVKGALSSSSVVYLGRVSYGTYLWHWPVIVVMVRVFEPTPAATAAVAILLATALASLSYQMLERPVRESRLLDRVRVPVIAGGLALSVFGAAVVMPAVLEPERNGTTTAAANTRAVSSGTDPRSLGIDWEAVKKEKPAFPDCFEGPVDECTIVHGTGVRVLLMGDSHARMLIPTFTEIAKRRSLTLSAAVLPVCPWQLDLEYVYDQADAIRNCTRHKADWYRRVLPELRPDVVVMVHQAVDDPTRVTFVRGTEGSVAGGVPALQAATRRTLEQLRQEVDKIVVVEPIPLAPPAYSPVDCLSSAETVDECRYVATTTPTPVERFYRSLADDREVWSLDIDRLVCPYFPICDPIIDGKIVKRDVGHLTRSYAASMADDLERALVANRVLE